MEKLEIKQGTKFGLLTFINHLPNNKVLVECECGSRKEYELGHVKRYKGSCESNYCMLKYKEMLENQIQILVEKKSGYEFINDSRLMKIKEFEANLCKYGGNKRQIDELMRMTDEYLKKR